MKTKREGQKANQTLDNKREIRLMINDKNGIKVPFILIMKPFTLYPLCISHNNANMFSSVVIQIIVKSL